MKFLNKILNFFKWGTGSSRNNFEKMLEKLASQAKQDEVRRMAFQAISKDDGISPDKQHPYEATLQTDSTKVDTACISYHVGILKETLGHVQYLSSLLKDGLHSQLAQSSPQEIEGKIKLFMAQHNVEADMIRDRYEYAKQALKNFKGENGLGRVASYPDKSNSIYWLFSFGIIEALFNTFFLRKGMDFTQSLFIAFSVAGINIIGNVFLGIRYRLKNHIDLKKVRQGRVCIFLSALLVLLVNIGMAWIRLNYVTSNEELNNVFVFESIILFVVGIGMGIAAFQKGYDLDDPYPGYGKLAREFDKWVLKLESLRRQHAMYCAELRQKADEMLDDLDGKIISTFDDFSLQLPDLARQVKVWSENNKQINFIYRRLQEIFKITITANHPKGNKGYPQTLQNLPENPRLTSYTNQIEEFLAQKNGIAEQVKRLRNSVSQQKEVLQAWWQQSSTESLLDFPKKTTNKDAEEKLQTVTNRKSSNAKRPRKVDSTVVELAVDSKSVDNQSSAQVAE